MLVVLLVVVGLVVLGGAGLLASRRVPGADEVLVVTGWRPGVVADHGAVVLPGLRRAVRVHVGLQPVAIDVPVTAAEGIGFTMSMEGAWQVRRGAEPIAARHFGDLRPGSAGVERADRQVTGAGAARLRAEVGRQPAAALAAGNRTERLAAAVRPALAGDVAPFGLEVTGLAVIAVADPTGYLADLVRIERAEVESRRRIVEAESEAAAVEAEERAARAPYVRGPK